MGATRCEAGRRTKIVATYGPACASQEAIARLIAAGVDVFRLNFSHGTLQEYERAVTLIRAEAQRQRRAVAILQDLQGGRLRTGPTASGEAVQLQNGQRFVLTTLQVPGDAACVSVSYQGLPRDLRAGGRVLLADGELELQVVETTATDVITEVVRGGELGLHKGINVPGASLKMPPLTEKDLRDLEFGVAQQVDYVALSFVRRGGDMAALRQALRRLGTDIPTIAKIETAEALGHLAAILKESDGVMVARGDLGVELPPEKVPMLQKQIILEANEFGIPCITATQMLQSMMHSPRPTRAEASDVANAILDGTDAVMLSGETAVGEYPLEAVETMARIALEVDSAERPLRPGQRPREGHALSLARAARALASEVGAKAVVVFTRGGFSARLLSTERPGCPIYAFTDGEKVYRRLALLHGVTPLLIQAPANTDLLLDQMPQELLMRGSLAPGDHVVIVRLSPSTARRHFNLVTVRTVGRGRGR